MLAEGSTVSRCWQNQQSAGDAGKPLFDQI